MSKSSFSEQTRTNIATYPSSACGENKNNNAKAVTKKKVLFLIRHGESKYNASPAYQFGDEGEDESLYDAPLTMRGRNEARALHGNAELSTAEVILVSPLTRALETLHHAFPSVEQAMPQTLLPQGSDVTDACSNNGYTFPPIEVWPLLTERLEASCDIGSGHTVLTSRWPNLDFSALKNEVWWYTDSETSTSDPFDSRRRYREYGLYEPIRVFEARVDDLAAALRSRPEHIIACFGHSSLFNALLERHCGVSDCWLKNGELIRAELLNES